jgi:hypothetical protein
MSGVHIALVYRFIHHRLERQRAGQTVQSASNNKAFSKTRQKASQSYFESVMSGCQ